MATRHKTRRPVAAPTVAAVPRETSRPRLPVPSSVQALSDPERAAFDAVISADLAERKARKALADAVASARGLGLTWQHIGYARGTSAEAARKRFGA